jgi:hypothetical protein
LAGEDVIELKLVLGSLVGWSVFAISQTVDGALEGVVLVGAAIGALGVIGHQSRKMIRFAKRVSEGVDLLFHLAGRIEEAEERIEALERADRKAAVRHSAPERV